MGKAKLRWNEPLISQHESAAEGFTPEDFTEEDRLISKTTESFVKNEVMPLLESIDQQDHESVKKLFQKQESSVCSVSKFRRIAAAFHSARSFPGWWQRKWEPADRSASPLIFMRESGHCRIFIMEQRNKTKIPSKTGIGRMDRSICSDRAGRRIGCFKRKTTAVLNREGTAWILNGEKQWITNAQVADVYVVFAKTAEGMTAFIVERSFKGVSIGPEEKKMGIKGSSTATLILEEVEVPSDNVLGHIGKGHHVALNILNMARLKLAFSNIGTAKQALNLAVSYAKQRKQFNKPIIGFSMIQEKIADMAVSIFGAESAAYRTADCLDNVLDSALPLDDRLRKLTNYASECAINKVYCSEILGRIADEAVQIHGGYGYMQEYEVERLYRDARISRIFEGTNEINRLTIAKLLMKEVQQNGISEPEAQLGSEGNRNRRFIQLSNRLSARH